MNLADLFTPCFSSTSCLMVNRKHQPKAFGRPSAELAHRLAPDKRPNASTTSTCRPTFARSPGAGAKASACLKQ